MVLIGNGKSEFCIAWKKENQPAEFAANELKKYVEKSTGFVLPAVAVETPTANKTFYVGFSHDEQSEADLAKTDLNGDGFVFEVVDGSVYLNAKTGRGLIFGVYDFLEKYFGIRFINMDCEVVPCVKDLSIPEGKRVERPDFAMRSYLNLKMLAGRGEEYDLYHLKNRQCNEHRHLSEKLGGECFMYGRGGTHNMHNYVPMEKYFKDHPDWYAKHPAREYVTIDLLNGITDDGKLDESMEISVAKVVIEELKKDVIANPQALYFQFEQEDSTTMKMYEEGSHEAKILEKYGRSGVLIRFCNMLATELQKWSDRELGGRPIYITTFAYNFTKVPPVVKKDGKYYPIDESVIPVDNLIIRMAFWSNCAYPYFDKRQTAIADQIEGWRAICNKFMFWAYDTDFTTFLWYFPTLHSIKKNIVGFKNLGVQYMMFQSSSAPEGVLEWQSELKCYIYSKLMWNTDLSVNELYDEYLTCYFGAAAEYVKKSMAIMENYSKFVESIYDKYWVDTFAWTYRHMDLCNEKLLNRVLSLLDEGEKAIKKAGKNVEVYLKHLANVKVTFLHMKVNKINRALWENISLSGVTRFSEDEDVPVYKKQSFYNVEMEHGVVEPVIIPDDVKEKINHLDVYSISDVIDLDA